MATNLLAQTKGNFRVLAAARNTPPIGMGEPRLPPKADLNVGDSVERFEDTYLRPLDLSRIDVVPGKYEPRPGDMYRMARSPFSNPPGAFVNPIGLVIGRETPGDPNSPIRTLDGNSTSQTTLHLLQTGKGGGLVVLNRRNERGAFPISHYIPQTLAFAQ